MFILYTTEDGKSQIQLRAEDETVWLTQLEIAELFNATKQNISLHLKNIFEDGELIHTSRRLPSPLSTRCAIPPLGIDRAQGVFTQRLRDGRRTAKESRRPARSI